MHLLYVYDDLYNHFINDKVDEVIKTAYKEAKNKADDDEGLALSDFILKISWQRVLGFISMTKLQKQKAAYGLVLKSLNVEIDEGILRECLLPIAQYGYTIDSYYMVVWHAICLVTY